MMQDDTISTARSTEQIIQRDTGDLQDASTSRIKQFFIPDLRMVPSKLSYLFFYGGQACYMTYFNVFFYAMHTFYFFLLK